MDTRIANCVQMINRFADGCDEPDLRSACSKAVEVLEQTDAASAESLKKASAEIAKISRSIKLVKAKA